MLSQTAMVVLGCASFRYRTQGMSEAVEFLTAPDEVSSANGATDGVETTPPLSEKKKNDLIFDRANQQCEWCGERFDHPHVHHIIPRSEGGPNENHNLVVLCPNCHEKADREAIPRSKLKAKVRRQPSLKNA